PDRDLAGELRVLREGVVVAVLQLVVVAAHDAPDELGIHRPGHFRVGVGDGDVGRGLLPHPDSGAVLALAACHAARAHRADADGVSGAAAAAAAALEAHAEDAAGVTDRGAGHVAHRCLEASAQAGAAEEGRDARVPLSAEDALGDEARLVLAVRI